MVVWDGKYGRALALESKEANRLDEHEANEIILFPRGTWNGPVLDKYNFQAWPWSGKGAFALFFGLGSVVVS